MSQGHKPRVPGSKSQRSRVPGLTVPGSRVSGLEVLDPGSQVLRSRLEPLRGGSLLFTTKFPEIASTRFIDLERMEGWVNLGATHWFWTRVDWESSSLTTWPLLPQWCLLFPYEFLLKIFQIFKPGNRKKSILTDSFFQSHFSVYC